MGIRVPFNEDVVDSAPMDGGPAMSRRLAEPTGESGPAPSLDRNGMVEGIASHDGVSTSQWCSVHFQNDDESRSASLCTQDSYPKPVLPHAVSLHDDLSSQEVVHPIPRKRYQDNHHVLTHSEPEIDMLDAIHRLRRQRRPEGSQQAHNDNREPPPEYISPVEDEVNGPIPELPDPLSYHRFYWNCMELKSELIRLDFSLRTIGSSGPGIQAARSVKIALMKLRDLYGANTSFLFPSDLNAKVYNPNESDLFLRFFSIAFNDFGGALDELAKALFEFNNVYHDEKLMLQLFSLHHRFKEEARTICFYNHMDPCELSEDIQVLLGVWVDIAITSLKDAIRGFHEKGVPSINYAQNNTTSGFFTLATIAFFLSGTTASMLQVAAGENSDAFGVSANSFLFSSLVFSIASAVSSLLAMWWHKSVVRVPDGSLPLWLKTWMRAGPMISLLISGAFFVVSLCLFVFASGQHTVTSAITVAFSGIHASGLLFLSGYFIMEKWRFRQSAGAIGRELTKDSTVLALIEWAKNQLRPLKWTRIRKGSFGSGYAEMGVGSREKCFAWQQSGTFANINELETTQRGSPVIWHALSDEKFILNSMFITNQHPTRFARRIPERSRPYIPGRARVSLYDERRHPRAFASSPPPPACLQSFPSMAASAVCPPHHMLASLTVTREVSTISEAPSRPTFGRQGLLRTRSCPSFTAGSAREPGDTADSLTPEKETRILRRSHSQPPTGLKDSVDDISCIPVAEPISTRSEAVDLWRRWREDRLFLFKDTEKLDFASAGLDNFMSEPEWGKAWDLSEFHTRSPSTPSVPSCPSIAICGYTPSVHGADETVRLGIEGLPPHRTAFALGEPEGVEPRYNESGRPTMTPEDQSARPQLNSDERMREEGRDRGYQIPPLFPPVLPQVAIFAGFRGGASSREGSSLSPSPSSRDHHGSIVHERPRQSAPRPLRPPSPLPPMFYPPKGFIPPRLSSPFIPPLNGVPRRRTVRRPDRSSSPALSPFAAPRIRSPSLSPSLPSIPRPNPFEPQLPPSIIFPESPPAMSGITPANAEPMRMPNMPARNALPQYPNTTLPQPGTVQAAAMFLPTPSALFQRRPRARRRAGRSG